MNLYGCLWCVTNHRSAVLKNNRTVQTQKKRINNRQKKYIYQCVSVAIIKCSVHSVKKYWISAPYELRSYFFVPAVNKIKPRASVLLSLSNFQSNLHVQHQQSYYWIFMTTSGAQTARSSQGRYCSEQLSWQSSKTDHVHRAGWINCLSQLSGRNE